MTASATLETIEKVIRSIFQQLDLSLDLDRNFEDSQFLRQDNVANTGTTEGKMTFVFDPNIFEVFVDPTIRRGMSASFHGDHWLDSSEDDDFVVERQRAVAAQTAALTTEYLFSRAFRERSDGRIYITEWHYKELASRLIALSIGLARARPTLKDAQARFSKIRQARQLLSDADRIRDIDLKTFREPLASDVRSILKNQRLKPRRLSSFVANRLVLDVLYEQNDLEKLDQLERLVAPEFTESIYLLHVKYRPNEREKAAIDQEAEVWQEKFREELTLSPGSGERSRTFGALKADAKSLAFVLWVARTLAAKAVDAELVSEEERIVFITADDIVYDAYRRWYANLSSRDADFRVPFVLRRLIQYAPVFNLSDAESVFSDNVREYFRRLKVAVEIAALPVNLSSKDSLIKYRMRELDALRLKNPDPIRKQAAYLNLARAVEDNDPEALWKELHVLLDYWRHVERITLGLFDDYVQARLSEMERTLPELRQDDPEVYEKALSAYFDRRLEELVDNSLTFSLPLAKGAIRTWQPTLVGERPRVPIAFSLILRDIKFDLGRHLRESLTEHRPSPFDLEDQYWVAMESQPEAIFALAAWLSLVSEEWREADRYAEQALLSVKFGLGSPQALLTSEQAEMVYLCVVTKKFQIAASGRPASSDERHRLHQLYYQGRDLIDLCVNTHQARDHTMRLQRARSERAALNLFYAATFTFAFAPDGDTAAKSDHHPAPDRALSFLTRAFQDLADCFDNDETASQKKSADENRRGVDARIREQFSINFASAYVLNHMWNSPADAERIRRKCDVDKWIFQLIEPYFMAETKVPPLLQLSLLGYLFLTGNERKVDQPYERLQKLGTFRNARLELDRQFHAAMWSHVNRSYWTSNIPSD